VTLIFFSFFRPDPSPARSVPSQAERLGPSVQDELVTVWVTANFKCPPCNRLIERGVRTYAYDPKIFGPVHLFPAQVQVRKSLLSRAQPGTMH
jgi:protein-disulfide isomerase